MCAYVFSNLQTMQCMELKLGTHVCLSVSITGTEQKIASGTFSCNYFFTSQTCTPYNETWYACVFQRFHDDYEQKNGLRHFFLLQFSNFHTIQCMEVKLGTHVYFSVSMTTTDKKLPRAIFPITTSLLLKLAHHTIHNLVHMCISAFP